MTTVAQQIAVDPTHLDTALNSWQKVQTVLFDPFNLIVIFLFAFGIVLKQSRHVPDWCIVFIVPSVGSIIGVGLFNEVLHKMPIIVSAMLGFVYGVGAVFSHQILKSLLASPYGAFLYKIPLVPILAGLMGVEPSDGTQTKAFSESEVKRLKDIATPENKDNKNT